MANLTRLFLPLLLAGATLAPRAIAQDSGPLIDLLVRKRILSPQEAEDLRAELVRDFAANTAAGKLNLSSNDTEFRISGDARVRYEMRSGELPSSDHLERNRFRYRLRGGITARVLNDWLVGLRVETSGGNRSTNVTLGDDGGPFAKGNDSIYVGQIYAQWNPRAGLSFTAGRMPNPLATTSMLWDGDINPEGLAEQYRFRSGPWEFSGTAAQLLYSAASTQNAFGSTPSLDDLLLFAWQGGVRFYRNGSTNYLQFHPTVYHYLQNDADTPAAFRGTFTPAPGGNFAAPNNLFIFDLPFEYAWLANDVPMRFFGDVAVNLDGDDRARKWGRPDLDDEKFAYQLGLQYGRAANTGEWDVRLFYQSVGAFALDPNLVDSDLFDSRTNMQGFVLSGNYALGAATQLTVTLARGERKEDSIIVPGSGDIGANNALDRYWLGQLDLNLRF